MGAISNAEIGGGGGGGGIKEAREASSEFDRVIAQTSETVTRGVSFLPRAAPFSISHQLQIQPSTVSRTRLGSCHKGFQNSLVSLLVFCLNQRCLL